MKTYGTVKIGDTADGRRVWSITCPPHVALRLKRVFDRVAKTQFGTMTISDTDENARELEWFLQRYPMLIDAADREYLRTRGAEHEDRLAAINEILSGYTPPSSFDLAVPARDYQRVAATLQLRTNALLLMDEIGLGKQQPVHTHVLTPSGYRLLGDVCVGDAVIGSSGQPVIVRGVFPQGIKPSYRVHMSDGSCVEAGPDHVWKVGYWVGGKRFGYILVTTDEIRTGATVVTHGGKGKKLLSLGKTKLYLPMLSAPVEFAPGRELELQPYVVGALIANGSLTSSNAMLSVNSEDWPEFERSLLRRGVRLGQIGVYGGATRVGLLGVIGTTRRLGINVLSGRKRIPEAYMTASAYDRIELLHGLMDCDGSCSAERNRVTYHTTSAALAGDVMALVECLGGIATVREYDRAHENKPTEYQVRVRLPLSIAPFTTARKAGRLTDERRAPTRTIERVEYVNEVESVCIAVDAPDQLYATEHAILTHNTAAAICTFTDSRTLPALVVAPTHLPPQWKAEIERFAPGLKVHITKSRRPYDLTKFRGKPVPHPDVIVTSYSKLSGWSEALAGKVRSVVFDEIQDLHTGKGEKYAAALHIARAAEFRLGLSATPINNYGGEIYNVIDVLRQGALGSHAEFTREWCSYAGMNTKLKEPRVFGEYLREQGLVLRRTRSEVGRELPPCTVIEHEVDADTSAIDAVSGRAAELARIILGYSKVESVRANESFLAAEELSWKLRHATGVAKAPYVADFVQMLVEQGEKVVLFGWHRDVYNLWAERLAAYKPAFYTGEESVRQKQESKRRFIAGETPILIVSLRAGAGLDGLQYVSRTCVIGELDWSPSVILQNIGRVDRDGQPHPVMAYVLVARTGSDPVVSDVLALKERQIAGIRDPKRDLVEAIEVDPDKVKRLAEEFLRQRGIALEPRAEAST